MTRAGRRPGPTRTRDDIIDSARALFAELGYERTTIRAIARRADVNPALVHHFYRTKDELLIAAVQLPFDPQAMIANAFAEPKRIGEALIRSLLALWDIPEIRDRMLALIRAAVTQPGAAAVLRAVLLRDVLGPIAEHLPYPDAQLRAEAAGAQLIGLAFARYIVALEPLASTTIDELSALIAPTLQRYLTSPTATPDPHSVQ